jgi:menaquinone-specific isochorismate synthase
VGDLVKSELIGDIPPLNEIEISGYTQSALWTRAGDGLVGFGKKASTTVQGNNRFTDARKFFQEVLNHSEIESEFRGGGPILFTSFAFDPDQPSELVVPEIVISRKNGKNWITWYGDQKKPTISRKTFSQSKNDFVEKDGEVSGPEWIKRVEKAISLIASGGAEKIVLAREIIFSSSQAINLDRVIANLIENYPTTWVYYLEGLIGATPELLIRLSKSLVTSRVLAGTIRKTGDEEKDMALAASLAKSSKDLEEHEYAVSSVADALEPFTSSINLPESPFVLHLANVMHLATDVTGVIGQRDKEIDIFSLLQAVHPSAAVCGTPKEKAFSAIKEFESMNRGRYAGPIGWVDHYFDGEMGIALRCAQISNDSKNLKAYAGCGIVLGSDPALELAESQAKFAPIRNALAN